MIPTTIHYCWFGGKSKPRLAEKCIKSWKKHCPAYDIIEWNEDNFDVNIIPFTKEAYAAGKFAFVSDYARLWVLYHHGGIYMDTDVELIRPLDGLLRLEAYAGFENREYVASGLGMGAVKHHPVLQEMMNQYHPLHYAGAKELRQITCPYLNTKPLVAMGLRLDGRGQLVQGMSVFPPVVFNPFDNATGLLRTTEDTYSIHWYGKSWIPRRKRLRSKLMRIYRRLFQKRREG